MQAYEQANVLHRDISIGNILTVPAFDKERNAIRQGLLNDWDLCKAVPAPGAEPVFARQPYRTVSLQACHYCLPSGRRLRSTLRVPGFLCLRSR